MIDIVAVGNKYDDDDDGPLGMKGGGQPVVNGNPSLLVHANQLSLLTFPRL